MLKNQNIGNFSGIGDKADTFVSEVLNRILRTPEGVNLPVLSGVFGGQKAGDKHYMHLYRLLDSLVSRDLINFEKIDGLKWYSPRQETLDYLLERRKAFTSGVGWLDTGVAKLNSVEERCKSALEIEKRALERYFSRRNEFWQDSRFLLNYKRLNQNGWRILNDNFNEYQDDVKDKVLIFKKKGADIYQTLPYKHRFQPKEIQRKIVEYNKVWDNANKFKVGVHLTCTFDSTQTLGEINEIIGEKFNWLISWVKSITKTKRLSYLKILEFQDSGRHHLHIIFFGISRIADKRTILSPKLEQMGFGKICFIYPLTNRNGKWFWKNARPEEAKTKSPRAHFKKYLEKSLTEDSPKTAAYWLFNKKFYTCSYNLLDSCSKEIVERSAEWEYIGIFSILEIPDFIFQQLDFKGEIT